MARLNGVHAFGYNSAGSEPIWMKFGAPRLYCLADFGRDPRRSETEQASRFFCPVNNARLCRLLVGQISRNLPTARGSGRWWILWERNFGNVPARGRFFHNAYFSITSPTTSDFRRPELPNDIDRWKLTAKWSLYRMSPFHSYRWDQRKVIPVACTARIRSAVSNSRSGVVYILWKI